MADRRASQVKSVAKAEKKRREEERKARVAARVKFESERTKEDLTKRKAPKPVGQARLRAEPTISMPAADVKDRVQILKEKLKRKKRKK